MTADVFRPRFANPSYRIFVLIVCLNCADKEEVSRYTYHVFRFEFYSCVSHSTGFSVAGDPHSFQYEIIII
jgi:hypothetical protein